MRKNSWISCGIEQHKNQDRKNAKRFSIGDGGGGRSDSFPIDFGINAVITIIKDRKEIEVCGNSFFHWRSCWCDVEMGSPSMCAMRFFPSYIDVCVCVRE